MSGNLKWNAAAVLLAICALSASLPASAQYQEAMPADPDKAANPAVQVMPEPAMAPAMEPEPPKPVLPPYKKKIVASAFNIDAPGQVEDINDIANGLPRELLDRLQRSGKFLVRRADSFLGTGVRGGTPSLKMIRELADTNDSQFVLSGTVRNAERSVEKKYLGLWNTNQRDIDIELTLYDGSSGSLIATHRVEKRVKDDVAVGREKTFGSKSFFSTQLGKAIDSMLDELADEVDTDLSQIPLSAKVLRVSNGQVMLDAGASSAIVAGDVLAVYRVKNEMPLTTAQQAVFGMPEVRVGTVAIAQVQPLFSVGQLSADARSGDVRPGDVVRSEPRLETDAKLQ